MHQNTNWHGGKKWRKSCWYVYFDLSKAPNSNPSKPKIWCDSCILQSQSLRSLWRHFRVIPFFIMPSQLFSKINSFRWLVNGWLCSRQRDCVKIYYLAEKRSFKGYRETFWNYSHYRVWFLYCVGDVINLVKSDVWRVMRKAEHLLTKLRWVYLPAAVWAIAGQRDLISVFNLSAQNCQEINFCARKLELVETNGKKTGIGHCEYNLSSKKVLQN